MIDKLKNISIQEDALILEPIAVDDYYKKTSSFAISKDKQYEIGKVLKIGKNISEEKIGQTVFFHKGIGTKIELQDRTKIVLITYSSALIFIK